MRLQGTIVPLATPLDTEEAVDLAGLKRLVDYVLPHVDAMFVRGTSGEFPLLDDRTADLLLEAVVEMTDGRVPIYVGAGDTGTLRTITRLRSISNRGVDLVAVTTPYYYEIDDQDELRSHFETIADASETPVLLYQIPQNTHNPLAPRTIAQLAQHPNIVGIKDSTGDMIAFQEILEHRSDSFSVLQGREHLAAASLWLGADGVVSALANLAPDILRELANAVDAGERDVAQQLQRKVSHLARVFDQGYWLSALKAALNEIGIPVGPPAQPLPPASDHQRTAIRVILANSGLGVLEGSK